MVPSVTSAAVSSRLASEASVNKGRSATFIADANPTVEPYLANAVSAVSESAKPLLEKSNIIGDGSVGALKLAIESAVYEVNHSSRLNSAELSFYVHEPTQKFVVEVKDKESGEIMGQFPTSGAIKVAQNIEELKGILLDRSV